MRTATVAVYKFEELSADAKERARAWMRELESQDFEPSYLTDDFETIASILGIEFDRRDTGRKLATKGGQLVPHLEPAIYWTGFSSQGDGACFEGVYRYAKGSVAAIKKHAPQDAELHRIAKELADLQKRYGYRVRAKITHNGRYYHRFSVNIDVHCILANGEEGHVNEEWAAHVTGALRDFMLWIYKQLEAEYEYRMSDESIDETIKANGYEFTEDGRRSRL